MTDAEKLLEMAEELLREMREHNLMMRTKADGCIPVIGHSRDFWGDGDCSVYAVRPTRAQNGGDSTKQ